MFKNIKNKKAASLMMILWYSVILFWLSWLLIWMLVSSQRFVWISEKYNMAIYWAESWIEQALFEINIHDIWFNDSTELPAADGTPKTQNWIDIINWFLQLNWDRLKYKWWVKWLNQATTETWYLVWKWNIDKILNSDSNRKYYKNFRKFYLYKDIWKIWENSSIENTCNLESTIIDFSVDWNDIYTSSDNNKMNVVQWRLFTNELDESWTWYYIESTSECSSEWNPKDPFCYKTDGSFTHNWRFEFNSTNTIWNCLSDSWEECKEQSIKDLLDKWWDPLNQNPFKPELILTYLNKLHETWDELNWLPIKYEISWCSEKLPSLVQEIESTAQTYWSVQKITAKIYQWNQWIDLSYTVIQ